MICGRSRGRSLDNRDPVFRRIASQSCINHKSGRASTDLIDQGDPDRRLLARCASAHRDVTRCKTNMMFGSDTVRSLGKREGCVRICVR
jgi:hypothetical protein